MKGRYSVWIFLIPMVQEAMEKCCRIFVKKRFVMRKWRHQSWQANSNKVAKFQIREVKRITDPYPSID